LEAPNKQPWSIGIQNPRESQKILARISVSNMAVTTSGDYEKFFIYQGKRYHHIFNPKDGFPAEDCQALQLSPKIVSQQMGWPQPFLFSALKRIFPLSKT